MVHPCEKPCDNKTASGYCATTACINPQFSNIGTAQYGQGDQKRIVTNADKIRAMSDEELAEYMEEITDPDCPPEHGYMLCKEGKCKQCWLDWLRQEATDG